MGQGADAPQRLVKKLQMWQYDCMNTQLKRILLFAAAIIFILLGLLGLVLPFLQGILFLVIGLILLSIVSPTARTWIEHHTRKFPKIHSFVAKTEAWITKIIGQP